MNEVKNDKYWIRQQDNLEFMKELEDGSIDLIYGDILYGTKKKFKDYDDNLWKTPQEGMLFYKPRLIEMNRVLKDTGSIYLQCDYRLVHYLKVLMDEIFSINNFINEIIWSRGFNGTESKTYFQKTHDTILFYSKNHKKNIWNSVHQKHKDNYYKRKNKKDEKGVYQDVKRYRKDGSFYYGKCYAQPKKADDVIEDIRLLPSNSKERLNYDTQKPKALLERIIKASSNEGNVVADFFAGSHTTGEVAVELGRYYIGCDIGDRSFEIGKERLSNE